MFSRSASNFLLFQKKEKTGGNYVSLFIFQSFLISGCFVSDFISQGDSYMICLI